MKTLYIEPGSPWQNGHVESFNGSLRDECLDRELMLSVAEARVLIEDYRRHYNEERPHGGIGYRTPAQARREALASSRPPGSLRPELDPSQPTSMIPNLTPNLTLLLDQFGRLDQFLILQTRPSLMRTVGSSSAFLGCIRNRPFY